MKIKQTLCMLILSVLFITSICLAQEARVVRDDGQIYITNSGAAIDAGNVAKADDGRAIVAVGDIASGAIGVWSNEGIYNITSASATTFALGAQVFWDASANLAITTAADPAADFYLGRATKAKIATELYVQVDLNALWDYYEAGIAIDSEALIKTACFVEAGAGTFTATIEVPTGYTVTKVTVTPSVQYAAATSASLIVGDAGNADGYREATDMKAATVVTELPINGAYLATPKAYASGGDILAVLTQVGAGTAGRFHVTVQMTPTANLVAVVKS